MNDQMISILKQCLNQSSKDEISIAVCNHKFKCMLQLYAIDFSGLVLNPDTFTVKREILAIIFGGFGKRSFWQRLNLAILG